MVGAGPLAWLLLIVTRSQVPPVAFLYPSLQLLLCGIFIQYQVSAENSKGNLSLKPRCKSVLIPVLHELL